MTDRNEYMRDWYAKNKRDRNAYMRKRYADNREAFKAKASAYRGNDRCVPASDLRPVPAHPDSVPTDPDLYCWACDHDTHLCGGCGEPVPHGSYACKECSKL